MGVLAAGALNIQGITCVALRGWALCCGCGERGGVFTS